MDSSQTTSAQASGYALFDLDQTLVPWDTQLLFCNFVLKRMPMRRFYLLILIPFLPLTKLLGAGGMKRVFLNYLWGLGKADLDELAEAFVEQHVPASFYGDMLDVLEEQKQLGRITVLSSASPEIWVRPIARQLGFDHYFGTTLEMNPRVKLFHELPGGNNKGANKLRKMRHLFPTGFEPYCGDKLPNSHGFSDSHADLPMLNICNEVTMVNPTTTLMTEGEKHSWHLTTPRRPTTGKLQFALSCLRQALGIYR